MEPVPPAGRGWLPAAGIGSGAEAVAAGIESGAEAVAAGIGSWAEAEAAVGGWLPGSAVGPEAAALFSAWGYSFLVSVWLLVVWRWLIAPALPNYGSTSAADRAFLANSFVSCYPALTGPFLALAALRDLPISDNERVLVAPPSQLALRAIGLSCGYMLYDTFYCLWHKPVRSPLIVFHHVLSIVFFPYATLRHRSILLILFFVITEVTNIGQHIRIILLKLGYERTRFYLINGVSWASAFFVVRILPSPYFFYKIVYASYAEFSTFDFYLAHCLMPIPFMLNSFWFWMLFTGIIKFLSKPPPSRPPSSKSAASKKEH